MFEHILLQTHAYFCCVRLKFFAIKPRVLIHVSPIDTKLLMPIIVVALRGSLRFPKKSGIHVWVDTARVNVNVIVNSQALGM